MRKRLLSLVMALAMIVGFAAWVPECGLVASAHSYSSNYVLWSQGDSGYAAVHDCGCWIVAMAKMIYETNIDRSSTFNPDSFAEWEIQNGLLRNLNQDVNQIGDGAYAPVKYANQKGKSIEYLGSWNAGNDQLWFNINAGYHTIVKVNGGGHYVLIANEKSKSTGTLYCYDSSPDNYYKNKCGGYRPMSDYSVRNCGYVYKAPNIPTDSTPPVISNVNVYDVSLGGYTVECTVTDEGGSGLDHVQFPTWTLENDQDDLLWKDGSINGSTVTFRVNISDHNNEYGIYRTHIYAYDNAGNYSCTAVSDVSIGIGHEMSEDEAAGQTIPDGDYWILSEMSPNVYLDIGGMEYPASSGIVIQGWSSDDLPVSVFETWTVTYLNNGFYKITQNGVNVAMEDPYASLKNAAIVKTYEDNESIAQQWSISKTSHGYRIQSRANAYYLDIFGAEVGNAVVTHEGNNGVNQSWTFVPYISDDRPVADGEYYIKSAAYKLYIGTQENGAYVGNTALDKFVLKYISDGYYTITEKSTGLSISVSDTGDSEYLKVSKRIVLKDYAEPCRNNLWRIVDKGNGEFCLISKCNGYYIDFDEFSTNVQSNQYSNYDTQRWSFIKEHKHSYTSKVTKNPTCTSTGIRKYTCSCGDSYTKTIPKLSHSYKATVVKPTCSAKGYTLHKCTKCGYSYKDTYTNTVAHKFSTWTTTKKATCTADGTQTRKCSVCEKTETKTIKATGHKFTSWTTTKKETCTADGAQTRKCSVCGKTESRTIKAPGHKFTSWTTTKKATCTTAGSKKRVCEDCGEIEKATIKKLGHSYKATVVKPTCTAKGYTLHKCTKCGASYKDKYTNTIAHKFSAWKTAKAATPVSTGTQTRTCSVCRKTQTRTLPKINLRLSGHNRYDTSISIADQFKKLNGNSKFKNVIIASGTGFADALSSAYLAKVKDAPILIVAPGVEDKIVNYVKANTLSTATIYIIGGDVAVPKTVDAKLKQSFKNVKRLWGKNRFGTNLAVLKEAGTGEDHIIIGNGLGYADALSASATGKPILLTSGKGLTTAQKAYLKKAGYKAATLIGESDVVSKGVESDVRKLVKNTDRQGGRTRFETSVLIAKKFFKNPKTVSLAYGLNYPDGLCGAPLSMKYGCPLILASDAVTGPVREYAKINGVTSAVIYGGSDILSDKAVKTILGK